MSEDLSTSEQVLIWTLLAAGGATLLKDIVPPPKGTHIALAKRGFLKISRHGQTRLIELEDHGWRWIADFEPFSIAVDEKRVTAERRLLQSLTRAIKRSAGNDPRTIQGLFRTQPDIPPRTAKASRVGNAKEKVSTGRESPPATFRDLEDDIRAAFYDLAGRPPRESVRLSALRAKLPDVSRGDLDRTLLAMRTARRVNLMNLDNPRDIENEKQAELRSGDQKFHLLWIDA